MPAFQSNPELVLSAFLRLARKQAEPIDWLEAIQAAALTGSSSAVADILDRMQDQFASTVNSGDGASTEWLRGLNCLNIAELCEAALRVLEAEAAADEAGTPVAGPYGVRYPDFSKHPCTLG